MNSKNLESQVNELGLTVGFAVKDWKPAAPPGDEVLFGNYCRCEPLDIEKHSEQLFHAFQDDQENRVWVYLPYGPFKTIGAYREWMSTTCFNGDPKFYAIIDNKSGTARGVASYLRITPTQGCIEVGHINYSPSLQSTIAATEAMYLMMKNAFSLGNRRYEWKCNALNEKSCNAALRLGFTYEGTFRQMLVVKGQNRDTAWYSLLDREWPEVKTAFETWLSEDNFDHSGNQKTALSQLTRKAIENINA
jgi:RimJ/RimL family protein N-acetyltransferase